MLIEIDGAKELVLVSVGVIGEVEEEWVKKELRNNYTDRFVKKAINELVNEKLIKKTNNGCLRLKKPNGLTWLSEKSSPLFKNYNMITNGHSFPGGEIRKKRREKNVKLLEHIFSQRIPINYIETHLKSSPGRKGKKEENNIMDVLGMSADLSPDYRSPFKKTGELKTLKELLQYIEPEDKVFFTSKIIRKEEHNNISQTTSRTNSSRMFGIYISDKNFYPVYCVESDSEWAPKIENQTNVILRNTWWEKWGTEIKEKEYQDNMKGASIFYYESDKVIGSVLDRIDKRKVGKLIQPWDVFEHAYYIPLADTVIEQIISENDFQPKLNNAVFGNSVKENSFYDALIEGNPAWELLTNDVVKIKKIKQIEAKIKEMGGDIILVIYPWQEAVLRSIYDDPKLIILNDKEVRTVIDSIKE